MSRRNRRSRREGGFYPPSRSPPPANPALRTPYTFRAWRSYTPPVVPYRPPRPRASPTLVHPARPLRTVRPLIRTVRTDTISPRRATRTHLDAMRRAVLRSRSPSPWSVRIVDRSPFVESAPLPRTSICARRVIRKEVLFALGQTGAGAAQKFRPRNPDSNVRC